VLSRKKTRLGNQVAVRLVMKPRKTETKVKSLMYIVVSNGYGYSIHCVAAADKYDEYEPVFEKACKTFQAFEPTPGKPSKNATGEGPVSPDKL
jgi:hypothetical protein